MKIRNKINRSGKIAGMILALLALSCLLPSCYKDKGTSPSDYVELPELRIDTAGLGLRPAYSLLQSEDILDIAPSVYYKGERITSENAANYPLDMSWVMYSTGASTVIDTLSRTVSVNTVLNRGAGTYTCLFTVTDTDSGIQEYCSFGITLMTNITDGYVVLYENADGNSDVGLIINDWISPTTVADRRMLDIFSGTNNGALPGKPVNIRQSERTITSAEVLIATETEYVGVSFDEFDVTYTASDLFQMYPGALYISYMGIGGNPGWSSTTQTREYLISGNELFYTERGNNQMGRPAHTKLGEAMTGTYGELAPWCAMIVNTNSMEAVVYDQTNTCFRYVAYGGVEILPFAEESSSRGFDITNTGMQMVASDWGFYTYMPAAPAAAQYYEYSLMKRNTTPYLLVSYWGTLNQARGVVSWDLSSHPGASDASHIAASSSGPFIYYANDDAVYLATHNVAGRTIQTGNLFWTPPAGEQITRIVIHKNASQMLTHPALASGWFTKDNEVLYVATWNEGTREGSVYQILVDPTNGSRATDDNGLVDERVYSGFGKIKDMCWKWPVFSM